MSVLISPSGLSTTALVANQLSLTAEYVESLPMACGACSSLQPQYSIAYTAGTPILNGTAVFVPVLATITIVAGNGCKTKTRLLNERFTVSFQGQTAVPTSVTIASVGRTDRPAGVKCGRAHAVAITDSITITIA